MGAVVGLERLLFSVGVFVCRPLVWVGYLFWGNMLTLRVSSRLLLNVGLALGNTIIS